MRLDWLGRDGKIILVEKAVRTIPYGFLGVLYAVYLKQLGFDLFLIGVVLSLSTAVGAILVGLPHLIGYAPSDYRILFLIYLVSGLVGSALYSTVSSNAERVPSRRQDRLLSGKSKPIVVKLSALFAVDAFGGGFIGQSILSLYFLLRFNLDLTSLGLIFAAASIVTAVSFLAAAGIARRIGLLRTMVFTHIPSNLLLLAVPFAPAVSVGVFLLLSRQSLSQMDVPARQSFLMSIVPEDDRTPAAGLTNVSRTIAQSFSPSLAGYAIETVWLGSPFILAGGLKLAYDLSLYRAFHKVKVLGQDLDPHQEKPP